MGVEELRDQLKKHTLLGKTGFALFLPQSLALRDCQRPEAQARAALLHELRADRGGGGGTRGGGHRRQGCIADGPTTNPN
eukprot:4253921-Pleurochrysis_carterae.AAC.2